MTEMHPQTAPRYELDVKLLAGLQPSERVAFEEWIKQLESEHVRIGSPYGEKPLAEMTGLECWFSFFKDGFSPAGAIEEDLSNVYD